MFSDSDEILPVIADDKYSTILSIKVHSSFKNVFNNTLRMSKQNQKKYFSSEKLENICYSKLILLVT